MRYLISIFTILSLWSCSMDTREKCQIDFDFKRNFDNCVEIAHLRTGNDSRNDLLDISTISRAINCLEILTGSKSKIKWECEGFGLYDDNGDFTYDQATWAQWYEQNKCTITMEKAEAIFIKTREPFPDYDDPKVLKSIASKLDESDRGS